MFGTACAPANDAVSMRTGCRRGNATAPTGRTGGCSLAVRRASPLCMPSRGSSPARSFLPHCATRRRLLHHMYACMYIHTGHHIMPRRASAAGTKWARCAGVISSGGCAAVCSISCWLGCLSCSMLMTLRRLLLRLLVLRAHEPLAMPAAFSCEHAHCR